MSRKKAEDRGPQSQPGACRHMAAAVDLPVFGSYTYQLSEALAPQAEAGKRVLVPFGHRKVTAYLLGPAPPPENVPAKHVLDILDETPLFPREMLSFFQWTADYYLHPLGLVIKTALPAGLNLKENSQLQITSTGLRMLETEALPPLEEAVLRSLAQAPCRREDLSARIGMPVPGLLVNALADAGKLCRKKVLTRATTGKRLERWVFLCSNDNGRHRLTEKRQAVIDLLQTEGALPVGVVKDRLPKAASVITAMEKTGLVRVEKKPVYRDPLGSPITPDSAPTLTEEQRRAAEAIRGTLGQGFAAFLLAGVTGSGKTEVYLAAADAATAAGHPVLVLVPEIGLISQMERRFRARFGEVVAILHSGLSAGERYDQWRRIAAGQVKIVVGTRSAVFAPFTDLGLVIVDEEHDPSYKQETGLRYNARDLAVVRAKALGATVVLGSATPSVQSYHNAQTKKFQVLSLTRRVAQRSLPEIQVVDLKTVRGLKGVEGYITPALRKAMRTTLARGEQVLLFLNRRGFANFPVCRACGNAITCAHCDITLTLHRGSNAFRCHFCGFSRPATTACPTCGADRIHLMGLGTEKVETGVKALFPNARVARMDQDTTARKGAVRDILKGLRDRTTDILIGTQMVAKGHDFPHITLVGIICADLSLSFPDFRAGERTFQLLAQVAGRAGRGEQPGRVVLQTYNPDHFSILSAQAQDFLSFYDREIAFRRALRYPPFARLIQIRITGKDKARTQRQALALGTHCKALRASRPVYAGTIDVLGPIEAPVSRIADRYRWQILLKGAGVNPIQRFVRELISAHPGIFNDRHLTVALDVDPVDML